MRTTSVDGIKIQLMPHPIFTPIQDTLTEEHKNTIDKLSSIHDDNSEPDKKTKPISFSRCINHAYREDVHEANSMHRTRMGQIKEKFLKQRKELEIQTIAAKTLNISLDDLICITPGQDFFGKFYGTRTMNIFPTIELNTKKSNVDLYQNCNYKIIRVFLPKGRTVRLSKSIFDDDSVKTHPDHSSKGRKITANYYTKTLPPEIHYHSPVSWIGHMTVNNQDIIEHVSCEPFSEKTVSYYTSRAKLISNESLLYKIDGEVLQEFPLTDDQIKKYRSVLISGKLKI